MLDQVKEMTISHSEKSTFESIEDMLLEIAEESDPVIKLILSDEDMTEEYIKFIQFNIDEISMENDTDENMELIEIIAEDPK